jgi:murein DD-endopeptidase MepM/ murein hydrolase activator NlpD
MIDVIKFASAMVGLPLATLCGGCGSSQPTGPSPQPTNPAPNRVVTLSVAGVAPAVGEETPFTASATYTNGTVEVVTSRATWNSSSSTIATVSPAGIVRGESIGEVTIAANYQDITGSARIVVQRPLCGSAPAATNRQIPIFSSPFQGRFRLVNYFDHEYPLLDRDPVAYQLSPCGDRLPNRSRGHAGIDYTMPIGTPIFAVADGEVTFAGLEAPHSCSVLGGRLVSDSAVEIRHPAGGGNQFGSRYVHLAIIDVLRGQIVTRGQQIGLSGDLGCTGGPHLHFAAWRFTNTNRGRATQIDPYGWEGPGVDPWSVHSEGADSPWLWLPGQAPLISQ